MGNKLRRRCIAFCVIAGAAILIFLNIEIRPAEICCSSIFTTYENTEINLVVLMNTLCPVDEQKLAQKIIFEEQQVNGKRNNSVYTLSLYRSIVHYRNDWEYDSFICDENGAIICDGDDSVL